MEPKVETESEEITEVSTPDGNPRVVKTAKKVVPPHVPGEEPLKTYETKKTIFRSYQVIWYILGVIEVLLIFRIILKMLGANASLFTYLIYGLSEPFALPFKGLFNSFVVGDNIIEWSSFIAIIVYLILAYGLEKLLQMAKPTSPEEVVKTVDHS